ncbi:MAG: hypothetical protein HYZ11_16730 [Candidatus Tectomicrobia bacterium]|uniref:Uncharacterized protein n=1 Tax=Tectimicrobiota bacterium TaxID=2528274 RepID=A0A932I0R6_UNCTE|nr:hypothetical protein [Candidatus Tectomicrobia bacterium]
MLKQCCHCFKILGTDGGYHSLGLPGPIAELWVSDSLRRFVPVSHVVCGDCLDGPAAASAGGPEAVRLETCPLQAHSEDFGLLCFNPGTGEIFEPPAEVKRDFCDGTSHFRVCPFFRIFREAPESLGRGAAETRKGGAA